MSNRTFSGSIASTFLAAGLLLSLACQHLRAVAVSWVPDSDGDWNTATNWSSDPVLPGLLDDVTISVGGATIRTVTHASGTTSISSFNLYDTLSLTGGTFSVTSSTTLLTGGSLIVSNGIFSTQRLSFSGGAFSANDLAGVGVLDFQNGGTLELTDPAGVTIDPAGILDSLLLGISADSTLIAPGGVTIPTGGQLDVRAKGTLIAPITTLDGGKLTFNTQDQISNLQFNSGQLAVSALTIGSTGPLGGLVTLDVGKSLNVGVTTTVEPDGTLDVYGGIFITGTLVINGGTVILDQATLDGISTTNFNAGTLRLRGDVTVQAGSVLGTSVLAGQTREIPGTATLTTSLTLNGGTLEVGSLVNGELFNLNSGIFRLTGDNLSVGIGGLFGSVLSLRSDESVEVTNNAVVDTTGTLDLAGGTFSAASLMNTGEILLSGVNAQLAGGSVTNQFLISGDGRISADLNNTVQGQINVGNAQRLAFTGLSNINAGNINISNGQVDVAQTLSNSGQVIMIGGELRVGGLATNDPGGFIGGTGSMIFRFDSGLNNAGVVSVANNGSALVFGDITNTVGGMVTISNDSAITFFGAVVNNSNLTVASGGTAVFMNDVTGAGGFTGGGSFDFNGSFAPGNSPASVTLDGDVSIGASGVLEMELAGSGAGAGTDFDQLIVTGNLSLAGTLDVVLINGFVTSLGDTFDILDFGSLTGAFSMINLPTLGAGLGWDTSNLLTTGELAVVSAGLMGDLDGDGFVGIADLNLVLGNWNQSVPPSDPLADPSGDGFVGIVDLNIVLGNWNAVTPPATESSTTVPEPGTAAVLTLGGTLLQRRQRRVA